MILPKSSDPRISLKFLIYPLEVFNSLHPAQHGSPSFWDAKRGVKQTSWARTRSAATLLGTRPPSRLGSPGERRRKGLCCAFWAILHCRSLHYNRNIMLTQRDNNPQLKAQNDICVCVCVLSQNEPNKKMNNLIGKGMIHPATCVCVCLVVHAKNVNHSETLFSFHSL